MSTVLITGGAGFIGSHLTESYLEKGYEVVAVDNLNSGTLGNLGNVRGNPMFHFYETDIRDAEALFKIFDRHTPDIVSHHAAQKSVPYSMENPVEDANKNIIGLLNVIAAAGRFRTRNFLYVSSGGALSGQTEGGGASREDDIPQLASPYAVTKYAGENYVRIYASKFKFDYSILRYANIYGPRQISDGECGVIPIFIDNILSGRQSVLTTYPDMPRGCTRDYVYVGDVVDANLLLTENPANRIVNIGSGEETSVLDIYEMLQKIFGTSLPIVTSAPRQGDIKRSVLDSRRIFDLNGWSARTSPEQGLTLLKKHISALGVAKE
ncbi:MAG: NAD-dependent epimerase/dehydratase family protein [Oscillospiraceae bacterium]|jgi:UDP-glucose 4-epimerase|nr:NAD-dependent epimerase/dehydratase family protein [Oscillospiraceae bacterium]